MFNESVRLSFMFVGSKYRVLVRVYLGIPPSVLFKRLSHVGFVVLATDVQLLLRSKKRFHEEFSWPHPLSTSRKKTLIILIIHAILIEFRYPSDMSYVSYYGWLY